MTDKSAIEQAERLLKEGLRAVRDGHYTIAETKADQAYRTLATMRVRQQEG